MDHSLLEQLNLLSDTSSTGDLDHYLQQCEAFLEAFEPHLFWVLCDSSNHENNSEMVNLILEDLDSTELPILFATLGHQPGVPPLSLPKIHQPDKLQYLEVSGSTIIGFARQQRFNTALIGDEDDFVILEHSLMNRLITISLMPEMDANPSAFSGHNIRPQDMPVTFAKALYQYCVSQPEIKDCRLAMVNMGAERWSLLMLLDCIDNAERSGLIEEITNLSIKLLPVNVELSCIALNNEGMDHIVSGMKSYPAFYRHTDSQGWWARLKRRSNPPLPIVLTFSES